MSKSIEKKESNLPAEAANMADWGDAPAVTANDIVIPKLLVAQQISDRVKEKKSEYGDINDSVTNEKLGDLNTPVEFIPFHLEKQWVEYDINAKGKREYKQTISIQDNPLREGFNDDLPFREDGLERDRVMLFYCLLPSKLEQGISLPYVLDFRRTSLKAGKKLATTMYVNNRAESLVPPAKALALSVKDTSNDDGSYCVQDVDVVRMSTKEEIEQALHWFKMVKKGGTKVDETDVQPEKSGPRTVSNDNEGKF